MFVHVCEKWLAQEHTNEHNFERDLQASAFTLTEAPFVQSGLFLRQKWRQLLLPHKNRPRAIESSFLSENVAQYKYASALGTHVTIG